MNIKRILSGLLVIVMLSSILAGCTNRADSGDNGKFAENKIFENQSGDEYVSVIVMTDGEPLLDGDHTDPAEYLKSKDAIARRASLVASQHAVRDKIIETVDTDAQFLYSYTTLLSGFGMNVRRRDVSKIEKLSGVTHVFVAAEYTTLSVSGMGTAESIIDSNIDSLIYDNDSKYRGEGTVIAIIDNGFEPSHDGMTLTNEDTAKIDKDYIEALKENLIASFNITDNVYHNAKFPFVYDYNTRTYLMDSAEAHGVHVAGIAAANSSGDTSKMQGVAPEAQILAMDVFNAKGTTNTIHIIAAMEDAITLGADVINLSIGSDESSSEDKAYEAAFERARENGVVIVCANGNSGRVGAGSQYSESGYDNPSVEHMDYGIVSSPASVADSIAVASMDSSYLVDSYFTYGDERTNRILYSDTTSIYVGLKKKSFVDYYNDLDYYDYYVVPGVGRDSDYASLPDLNGGIALICRGELSFAEKTQIAFKHGAAGVIIYNNDPDEKSLVQMDLSDARLPAIFISYADGQRLISSRIKHVSFTRKNIGIIPTGQVPGMSSDSSWGVTSDLKLKPEITAVGQNVYSTLPGDSYGVLSGTSMAAPVISGASALLSQRIHSEGIKSTLGISRLIKNLLMNTAKPIVDESCGFEFSVRRQGAGLVDISSALNSGAVAYASDTTEAKIELGDKLRQNYRLNLTVYNFSVRDITYSVSTTVMANSYFSAENKWPSDGPYLVDDAVYPLEYSSAVLNYGDTNIHRYHSKFGAETVTVRAGESIELSVYVSLSEYDTKKLDQVFTNGYFIEGFVMLEAAGEPSLSVPYVGYRGDWSALPIFDDTVFETPFFDGIGAFTNVMGEDGYLVSALVGTNVFDEEEKYASELVMFSPNNDSDGELIGFKLYLMRTVADYSVRILDAKSGEVLDEVKNIGTASKSYLDSSGTVDYTTFMWDGRDVDNEKYIYPDGEYTIEIRAIADCEGAKEQTFSMNFTIDRVSPSFDGYRIVEEKEGFRSARYLYVDVSDDRYVQATSVYTRDDAYSELVFVSADDPSSAVTHKYDITDIDDEYVYIDVIDHAMNEITQKIRIS